MLPFAARDGDPDLDRLAVDITGDLTSGLGRLPANFVIGAGVAAADRGPGVDVRRVGAELGVRYVVEGTLRRLGPVLRVDARLLDAASGAQLWVETLDHPHAAAAELPRTAALRMASGLNYRLYELEGERTGLELPREPTAQDLILHARLLLNRASPRDGMEQARRMVEQALAMDEGAAEAHALLAHVLVTLVTLVNDEWTEDIAGTLEAADRHAARALAIDPRQVRGHYVRGMANQNRRRFDEAAAEYDLVIEAAPNFAVAYRRRGTVKILTGRPAEGAADVLEAIRISPRDAYVDRWYASLGIAALMQGRDEEAVGHLVRARAANSNYPDHLFRLAAAYALTGRRDDARIVLDEFRRARPDDTLAGRRRSVARASNDGLFLATWNRMHDAAASLGMPEGQD